MRIISWRSVPALIALIISTVLTTGCMHQIAYQPSQLETFDDGADNLRLEFETAAGRQVAFYIPPLNSPEKPPQQLNILYPGIYAVALGWQRFIAQDEDPDAAYLLIDYPGRGLSEGRMNPEKVYLNTEGALKVLAKEFGVEKLDAEINLLGHSFGTGAALQFAERVKVSRIVLIAPFNTLRKAAAEKSWFLSIIMPVQIDNGRMIRDLLKADLPTQIIILHGGLDKTLPVTMGRELAAINPERIKYYEFPEDGHVSILTSQRDLIFNLLTGEDILPESRQQASHLKR